MACEGGGEGGNRRVTRTGKDGTIMVLASHYEGKRLNSPNDLAVDSRGRIYFTDPRYGNRDDVEQFDEQGREIEGVYRIDTDGSVTRIIDHEAQRPNGIAISAEGKGFISLFKERIEIVIVSCFVSRNGIIPHQPFTQVHLRTPTRTERRMRHYRFCLTNRTAGIF